MGQTGSYHAGSRPVYRKDSRTVAEGVAVGPDKVLSPCWLPYRRHPKNRNDNGKGGRETGSMAVVLSKIEVVSSTLQ